jgi:hypothetical protein
MSNQQTFKITAAGRVADPDYVPIGDRLVLPERFHAVIEPDDPALPRCYLGVAVERGRAVCVELRCERREDGPPVTGEALRQLPIAAFTREATRRVTQRLVADPDGEGVRSVSVYYDFGDRLPVEWEGDTPVYSGTSDPLPAAERFDAQYARSAGAPRRRGPMREEDLREVAGAYRGAVAAQEPPTRAVAARFGVSRSTAGRWVAEARQRGMLGKARPRMAGELGDAQEQR